MSPRPARSGGRGALAVGLALTLLALLAQTFVAATADAALTEVDLGKYKRAGRFDLPVQTPTPPDTSLLASEASGITSDWDTDTLFTVGDEGTRSSRSARAAR